MHSPLSVTEQHQQSEVLTYSPHTNNTLLWGHTLHSMHKSVLLWVSCTKLLSSTCLNWQIRHTHTHTHTHTCTHTRTHTHTHSSLHWPVFPPASECKRIFPRRSWSMGWWSWQLTYNIYIGRRNSFHTTVQFTLTPKATVTSLFTIYYSDSATSLKTKGHQN